MGDQHRGKGVLGRDLAQEPHDRRAALMVERGHHAMRSSAITTAAREILGSEGAAGLTPAAVAKRAGIARTSVYLYYPSSEALLAGAIDSMFELAERHIASAAHGSDDPWLAVRAYVEVALRAAAGEFGSLSVLSASELPSAARAQLAVLYRTLAEPLADAVARLGTVPAGRTQATTTLLLGVIGAAVRAIRAGGRRGHDRDDAGVRRPRARPASRRPRVAPPACSLPTGCAGAPF